MNNIIAIVDKESPDGKKLGKEYTKLEIGGGIAHCITTLCGTNPLQIHHANCIIVKKEKTKSG